MEHNALELLNYRIFDDELSNIDYHQKQFITTINQYSYCIAEKDDSFRQALQQSEILLPDGIGIVIAAKLLENKKIKKIAGADIHQYLLEKLNETSAKCMYLGASDNTLSKIEKRLSVEYPNIKVSSYSPPYKNEFSEKDNQKMINAVNSFKPNVLFIGMTAPKQEKWGHTHKNILDANTICAIGAVFDFYAGTVERPSKFWIKLHLEWFIRLIKEPKRMWRRYLYYGPFFGYMLIKVMLKQRK